MDENFTITIGRYPDGAVGEVFIDGGKTGQDIQSTARDAAVVLSLAYSMEPPSRRSGTLSRVPAPQEAASILGATVDALSKFPRARESARDG